MSRSEYRQMRHDHRLLSQLLKLAYRIPDRTTRQRAVANIQAKLAELN